MSFNFKLFFFFFLNPFLLTYKKLVIFEIGVFRKAKIE